MNKDYKYVIIVFTVIIIAAGYGCISGPSVNSEVMQLSEKYISTEVASDYYDKSLGRHSFLLFPEVREDPVQWFDSLRVIWMQNDFSDDQFELIAQPGEYFTYQLVVWAIDDLDDVQVRFSELKGSNGKSIPVELITCFNTGGIDHRGQPFTKKVQVQKGRVQSLWVGIDLKKASSGIYRGNVSVVSDRKVKTLPVILSVEGDKVPEHGYPEGNRLSRLNWLNSTVGLEDKVTKPFIPLLREGNNIKLLGRQLSIGSNGLPSSIQTFFTPSNQSVAGHGEEILNSPMRFVIEKGDGQIINLKPGGIEFKEETGTGITWIVNSLSDEVELECKGTLEFDGHVEYKLTVKSLKRITIKDIRLEADIEKEKAEYMMGLNTEGGFRPEETHNWKWDTILNQDMLWIGSVNGGLRFKWKAENYVRPLVNIYYIYGPLNLPPSWANQGEGGVRISESEDNVMVNAYSGSREMKKGEVLHYDFELLITPFKPIDKNVQFDDRYYHPILGTSSKGVVEFAEKSNANIINIHHGCDLYPFINYPYVDEFTSELTQLINDAQQKDIRMKLYYTTRELTKNIPEFWAFRSLDGEIVFPGAGNDYVSTYSGARPPEWCKVNLREKYLPAWAQLINEGIFEGVTDISVITTPDSRLNNFYLAGLEWMVSKMDLDGIYIDDAASDRTTLRRARMIIDKYRPAGRIDLHSWNIYCEAAGFGNCLNVYMDLLPYIDLTWIGEDRDYNRLPDHWLVEQSGIPFGLPGQMLHGGGNPWRGMVFGQTNRLGWGGNPVHIWKFWDDYRIKEKEMIGYWDKKNNPLMVSNDLVKATLYKGDNESIIAVAAWGETEQRCNIDIDWNMLGYDEREYRFYLPEIPGFQQEQTFSALQSVAIPQNRGFLIVITPK